MELVQMLSCSDVGTCCSNYALANLLDVGRRIVALIQMVVPIVLIAAASYQLGKMMLTPDDKNGIKSITNKAIAAAVVFFIPMLFNISVGVLPEGFSFAACWKKAQTIREVSQASSITHYALDDRDVLHVVADQSGYEKGVKKDDSDSIGSVSGTGGQKIVNVALGEIGNNEGNHSHHKYETYNNLTDDQPWCAAFVSWCAGKAGFVSKGVFPKFTACTSQYSLFKKVGAVEHLEGSGYDPKAGDIIFYGSAATKYHVGIVIKSTKSYVYTVEGNTTCESNLYTKGSCPKSDGVYKRARKRPGSIYSYMTPKYTS